MNATTQQNASEEAYYLYYEDKQHGPLSSVQVRGLYLDGVIGDETPACQAGMADWQPLRVVLPELLRSPDAVSQTTEPSSMAVQPPPPSERQFHITRNGQQFGPYTLEEVKASLVTGELSADDLAWYDGAAGWVSLRSIEGITAPCPSTSVPASSDLSAKGLSGSAVATEDELNLVAKLRSKLLKWFYCALACGLGMGFFLGAAERIASGLFGVGAVLAVVMVAVSTYKLASAIRSPVPWLYCALVFVPAPLVGLIALAVLERKARKFLKQGGIHSVQNTPPGIVVRLAALISKFKLSLAASIPASHQPAPQPVWTTSTQTTGSGKQPAPVGCVVAMFGVLLVGIVILTVYAIKNPPSANGGSLRDAHSVACEFIRQEIPGARSISSFDDSGVEKEGSLYTVAVKVDGLNAFGGPVRNNLLVELEYQESKWVLKRIY